MNLVDLLCGSRGFRKRLEDSRQRLYRMALAWSGDAMLADDLAQETLTKALQKAHQLREDEKLECWLYSILNNAWREHLRRRRPMSELDEEQFVCEDCPETRGNADQIVDRVRAAIARLPVGQREVVTLVDLEGFAYAEVAKILEIPIGTVMSRLSRARRALQSALIDMQPTAAAQRGRHLRSVK